MKKILFFIVCGFSFLCACDAIFLDVRGKEADLQGKWQMEGADTVYYNFQKNQFQYQIYRSKDSIKDVFGYYTLHGDTAIELKLLREYASFPLDYLKWDTLYASTGQDTLFKAYKVEALTKRKLILSSDEETLSFRKF